MIRDEKHYAGQVMVHNLRSAGHWESFVAFYNQHFPESNVDELVACGAECARVANEVSEHMRQYRENSNA